MITVTKQEVANYLGVNEGDLPSNIEKLILISGTLVNHSILNNYNGTTEHDNVIKQAICAQVDYFNAEGMGDNPVKSYTNDDISITYEDSKGNKGTLCTTARIFLNSKNLLYRGGIRKDEPYML